MALVITGVDDVTGEAVDIALETTPIYEYRSLWAEENGNISTGGNSQFSFGNGATGNIGVPFTDGWEIYEYSFHCDAIATNSNVIFDVMDFQNNGTGAADRILQVGPYTLAAITGSTANAQIVEDIRSAAVSIPSGAVVGFRTRSRTGGNVTDVRLGIECRRVIGTAATGILLNA